MACDIVANKSRDITIITFEIGMKRSIYPFQKNLKHFVTSISIFDFFRIFQKLWKKIQITLTLSPTGISFKQLGWLYFDSITNLIIDGVI